MWLYVIGITNYVTITTTTVAVTWIQVIAIVSAMAADAAGPF